MRIQWRKEWTTPAIVGVSSFAAGVGAGLLGYRIKVDRDIQRGLEAMSEIVKKSAADVTKPIGVVQNIVRTDEGIVATGEIDDPEFIKKIGPAHRREGLDPDAIAKEQRRKMIANEFAQAVAPVPTSDELPILGEPAHEVIVDEACEIEPPPDPEPVVRNVFEGDPNWDQAVEESKRATSAGPYIISQTEFFANETGFRQTTMTWYDGDSILTDENDVPIYGAENILGHMEFGRGTNDKDTVYIRNPERQGEYEVLRVPGSYQIVVMGLQAEEEAEADELRHSQQVTRFRMD